MATATVTTRQTRLNIRQGPSIQTRIVGKLNKGTTIDVGELETTAPGGGWVWVKYNGNWVCQQDPRYSYPFLHIDQGTQEQQPAEQPKAEEAPKPPEGPSQEDIESALNNMLGAEQQIEGYDKFPLDGSAALWKNKKENTYYFDDALYDGAKIDRNKDWYLRKVAGRMTHAELKKLNERDPSLIQNKAGYPPKIGFNNDQDKQWYEYDYHMDYERDKILEDMDKIRDSLNFGLYSRDELFRMYTNSYNRFKTNQQNDVLAKSYPHVFFVRPDCNILTRAGENYDLVEGLKNDPNFVYAYHNCPEILRQLVMDGGYDSDFMMYLSNRARSFNVTDEFINVSKYGKTFTGHQVAYGKTNIESKTAGDFSIEYYDDRNLHVFHLHKMWADYISGVFQGMINPKHEYILDKIMDYATCLYYIVTAEDGETVIFWSKYYGVFPQTIPSAQYSWASGNLLSNPSIEIRYHYSFKEDYNPLSLVEFNMNSKKSKGFSYVPVINSGDYMVNTTWVGAPFIETFNTTGMPAYTFKLRFREAKKSNRQVVPTSNVKTGMGNKTAGTQSKSSKGKGKTANKKPAYKPPSKKTGTGKKKK